MQDVGAPCSGVENVQFVQNMNYLCHKFVHRSSSKEAVNIFSEEIFFLDENQGNFSNFEEEISMPFGDDAAKWWEQSEKLGRTLLTNLPFARYI